MKGIEYQMLTEGKYAVTRFIKHLRKSWPYILTITAFLQVSCTSYESSFDRSQMLAGLATGVMAPTIARFSTETSALQESFSALCDAPSADMLIAAQSAWRTARAPWKRSEAFAFGPVKDLRTRSDVDWAPAEGDQIEQLLAGSDEITPDLLALQGAGARGFLAMEYLLFAEEGNEQVLASFGPESTDALSRCQYLLALASVASGAGIALNNAWQGETGFAQALATAGEESAVYTSTQAALNDLVNALIFGLEDIAGEKLGMPMGLTSGGSPQPDLVQAALSDNAIQDILENLEGLKAVYEGDPSTGAAVGIGSLIADRKDTIDTRIREELDTAFAAVAAIPGPLEVAVVAHPSEVQTAWNSIKALQTSFTTDVAALLGVTLTFNDNDGD